MMKSLTREDIGAAESGARVAWVIQEGLLECGPCHNLCPASAERWLRSDVKEGVKSTPFLFRVERLVEANLFCGGNGQPKGSCNTRYS